MAVGRGMDDKGALKKYTFSNTLAKSCLEKTSAPYTKWIKAKDKRRWQGKGF